MQAFVPVSDSALPVDLEWRRPPDVVDGIPVSDVALVEVYTEPTGQWIAVVNRAPLGQLHTGHVTWTYFRAVSVPAVA